MRPDTKHLERYRVKEGPLASDASYGMNGAFLIPCNGVTVQLVVSDGEGWEHVSASLSRRCPTWEEMARIKDLFFEEEETVMQLHVPKSEHVNCHPYCLHLWRPKDVQIPLPPGYMVGPKL